MDPLRLQIAWSLLLKATYIPGAGPTGLVPFPYSGLPQDLLHASLVPLFHAENGDSVLLNLFRILASHTDKSALEFESASLSLLKKGDSRERRLYQSHFVTAPNEKLLTGLNPAADPNREVFWRARSRCRRWTNTKKWMPPNDDSILLRSHASVYLSLPRDLSFNRGLALVDDFR